MSNWPRLRSEPGPQRNRRRSVPSRGCLAFALATLSVSAGLWAMGCNDPAEPTARSRSADTPVATQLPPLELRDDTKQLLLTWIDDKGDFHVVRHPAAVPGSAKSQVRVVVTTQRAGTLGSVYVANLTAKQQDGSYPVRTMSRAEWNELGASKRAVRLEARERSAEPDAKAPREQAPEQATGSKVAVVLYGADWCPACRKARRFLESHDIPFLEKDVDESDLVKRELQQKLSRAGLPPTTSIPVLDVRGEILVGFDPAAVAKALDSREAPKSL